MRPTAYRHLLKFSAALFLLAAFLISPALPGAEALTWYVTQNGTGINMDGRSWATAYGEAEFFNLLAFSAQAGDEVWVAKGTYLPIGTDTIKNRTNSFILKSGVKIYGGFSGTETALDQRDWKTNETILSGELGGGINSYHVVDASSANDINNKAVLNGFTITKGRADGSNPYNYGGGLYSVNGIAEIWNCTFTDNSAIYAGGALTQQGGNLTLAYCTFTKNYSGVAGGSVLFAGTNESSIVGCTFSENESNEGGGLYNSSSTPILTNNTFFANKADTGGALYNSADSDAVITNCTFSRNSATSEGSGMYSYQSDPSVINSIFWDSGPSEIAGYNWTGYISYSIVNGGFLGGTNINADPRLAALADNGGPTMTCALLSGSPAIDAGTTSGAPAIDQRGISRPQGSGVDIGAYEYVPSGDGGGGGGCQSTTPAGAAWLMIPLALVLLRRKE